MLFHDIIINLLEKTVFTSELTIKNVLISYVINDSFTRTKFFVTFVTVYSMSHVSSI